MEDQCEKKIIINKEVNRCTNNKTVCQSCDTGDSTYCIDHSLFMKKINDMTFCDKCITQHIPDELEEINLINFHKFGKNKRYVKEKRIFIAGQGLVDSWKVDLRFILSCKLVISVLLNDKKYLVTIKSRDVNEWIIKTKYDDEKIYSTNIKIDALGNFNKKGYFKVRSGGDGDDVNHLYINDVMVLVTNIDIKLCKCDEATNVSEFNNIKQFVDVWDKLDDVNLNELKSYHTSTEYYIVTPKYFIPFSIFDVKFNDESCEYLAFVKIYIDGCYHKTHMKITDEKICKSIEFTISIDELNYKKEYVIAEYVLKQ